MGRGVFIFSALLKRYLNYLSSILQALFEYSLNHRWPTFIFAILGLIFLIQTVTRTQFELNIYDVFDPNFSSTVLAKQTRESFKDQNDLTIIFKNKQNIPLTANDVCAIERWLSQEKMGNPDVDTVISPFDLRAPRWDGPRLWHQRVVEFQCDKFDAVDLKAVRNSPGGLQATNEAGTDYLVNISLAKAQQATIFGEFDGNSVDRILESIKGKLLAVQSDLAVHLAGRAAALWHLRNMFLADWFGNPLVFFLILVFFRLFFGTWRSGLIFSLTLILTGLFVYGSMALVGSPVNFLTNNVFLITCIAGIEDFLFVLHHNRSKKSSLIESFRALLVPSFFTSLTTVVGFGSLLLSDIKMVRSFGAWSAFGSIVEWVVTFLLIPPLLQKRDLRLVKFEKSSLAFLRKIDPLAARPRMIFLSMALLILSIGSIPRIHFDYDPRKDFPDGHLATRDSKYLQESRHWTGTISLVFPDSEDEAAIQTTLGVIRSHQNIAAIDDPLNILNRLSAHQDPAIKKMIEREFRSSATFKKFYSDRRELRAVIYLKEISLQALAETQSFIESSCELTKCFPTGELLVVREFSEQVSKTLFESFFGSLILVSLIIFGLSVALGANRKFRLLYSVIWCPMVMIGLLVFFQVPINFITVVFAAVLVGLTGDNAIQFLFANKSDDLSQGVDAMGLGALQLLVLLVACSLVFLSFTMVPMKVLGILFAVGFLASWIGDIWLLRGLLKVSDRPKTCYSGGPLSPGQNRDQAPFA